MSVVFSVPRSGSTLVWNIVCIITDTKPHKTHTHNIRDAKTVITYRHPYDSVASLYRCKDGKTVGEFKDAIREIVVGIDQYLKYTDGEDTLYIKYEDMIPNLPETIAIIGEFLGKKLTPEEVEDIYGRVNVEQMTKIADSYKDFSVFDHTTRIHGNHIGGVVPDQWKDLSDEYRELLDKFVSKYIEPMGYIK